MEIDPSQEEHFKNRILHPLLPHRLQPVIRRAFARPIPSTNEVESLLIHRVTSPEEVDPCRVVNRITIGTDGSASSQQAAPYVVRVPGGILLRFLGIGE